MHILKRIECCAHLFAVKFKRTTMNCPYKMSYLRQTRTLVKRDYCTQWTAYPNNASAPCECDAENDPYIFTYCPVFQFVHFVENSI